MKPLEQCHQLLEEQHRQLEAQVDRRNELAGLVLAMENFCARVRQGLEQATSEQKRQLVDLLIDRVIASAGEVEIRYVMPTAPSGEQTRFCHLRLDYREFTAADSTTRAPHEGLPISRAGAAISRSTRSRRSSLPAQTTPPLCCSIPSGTRATIAYLAPSHHRIGAIVSRTSR